MELLVANMENMPLRAEHQALAAYSRLLMDEPLGVSHHLDRPRDDHKGLMVPWRDEELIQVLDSHTLEFFRLLGLFDPLLQLLRTRRAFSFLAAVLAVQGH